jgi:protein phosphatase
MGTTLTAAMLVDNAVSLGHVGDSRAYRFRDDKLERLTQDHSLVEELMRMGRLSPEDAEVDPRRSIITRALGPEPTVDVETCTYPAKDGDVYMLCSDGLTGMVSEERMAEILRARSSLEQAARALVDEANAGGGKDNITVVLFKLADDDSGPDEEESDTISGTEKLPAQGGPAVDPGGNTMVIPASPRPQATVHRPQETALRSVDRGPSTTPPPVKRSRARWPLAAAVVLIIVIAALGGLYAVTRQLYFVGTDNTGLVTLYRGVPYNLPFGIDLYTREYESTVPASSLPARQRSAVLDHRLRSRSDAVDLVRSLERSEG